ncbi:MAG: DegV family protein, partial [Clostridia bacterium]|nr:DegV family protein [Clostridia bacterium]
MDTVYGVEYPFLPLLYIYLYFRRKIMSVKKVKITTDSTVDFTPEIVEKYDITVMPLYIVTDEGEYRDTLDITPDDVYAYYDK